MGSRRLFMAPFSVGERIYHFPRESDFWQSTAIENSAASCSENGQAPLFSKYLVRSSTERAIHASSDLLYECFIKIFKKQSIPLRQGSPEEL